MEEKITRRGFLGTIAGGLAALAIVYAAGGCASAGKAGITLRGEESYVRAPRAEYEVAEEDHLGKIVRGMREALDESDEILKGDFQTYLQKRRARLEESEDPLTKYCKEKGLECE
ncbi:MAG: hypothetical protein AABY26_05960 [Nanoarchaeota archaeon]